MLTRTIVALLAVTSGACSSSIASPDAAASGAGADATAPQDLVDAPPWDGDSDTADAQPDGATLDADAPPAAAPDALDAAPTPADVSPDTADAGSPDGAAPPDDAFPSPDRYPPVSYDPAISPLSLAFGSHRIGTTTAAQEATLANVGDTAAPSIAVTITGAAPGEFAIVGDSCKLGIPAASSCKVSVVFRPTLPQASTAYLYFALPDGHSATVSLSGSGIP